MKLYEIGQKVRILREQKGLTQENLAKLCGISRVTLGKIEKGELANSSVRTLSLLLDVLGYEIDFKLKQNFGILNLDEIEN